MPDESIQLNTRPENPPGEFPAAPEPQPYAALVAGLAALVRDLEQARPGQRAAGLDLPGKHLAAVASCLEEAHRFFRETASPDVALTSVAEWILDNYYVIRQALAQIREDLPVGYYQQLPKIAGGPLAGCPRVYALAHGILNSQNLLLNPVDAQMVLHSFQKTHPLTMGELWAFPIFLRYDLLDTLADGLQSARHPGEPAFSALRALWPPENGADPALHPNQTVKIGDADPTWVSNIILSLRAIAEQDWNEFFETVSRTEKILRTDPARIYARMDFKTRDQYRKAIEALSFSSGLPEEEVAEIAIELARAGREPGGDPRAEGDASPAEAGFFPDEPRAHVGEYIQGAGLRLLEERSGCRPAWGTLVKRWASRHATSLYLGAIFLLAVLIAGAPGLIASLPTANGSLIAAWAAPPGWMIVRAVLLALLIAAGLGAGLTVAANLVNWLVTLYMAPRALPKLEFKEAIPDQFRTLVVVPALISSREEVDALVHQLEMHFWRNQEPGLGFALLTDFPDADHENLPGDAELLAYAAAAVERLNTLHAGSGFFYFFHRKRLWNPSEGKWMGWERKRGKLHDLNLLLRGRQGHSFTTLSGDLERLLDSQASTRFVITLDADTILPPGAARRLVGTLAHPLNRAQFDPESGRVLSGYTILQPRMETHPKSIHYSWFTRIFAGDTGLDLYTHAVSDVYQDLFREGSYVGKGIYDIDAFERSLQGHIPENTILSHDLLEGLLGRAGLVTDITLIEDYPLDYFVQVMRQRRWMRGDWQLIPWLVWPAKYGVRLSAIDRWKIIDNLLRSLLAPALMAEFILGLVTFPAQAGLWAAAIVISLGVPCLTSLAAASFQVLSGRQPARILRPMRWAFLRWLLAATFLPYEAINALDAILTTLYRLFVSHRHLLQWTTAAQTRNLFGSHPRRKAVWLKLTASSLLAVGLIVLMGGFARYAGARLSSALWASAPVLVLWVLSPLIAQWINQPIAQRAIPAGFDQAGLLRQIGRRTWSFFERYAGPQDHWLPPDNYQEAPLGRTAHHTSPTNIGLLLTSTLAAYDLGYIDQLSLATRLANTVDSLDQMERFRGHFLNWYDTLTLQPLQPRYISTVDSGNLAACLLITAQACKSLASQPVFRWENWLGYLDSLSTLGASLGGMLAAGQVRAGEARIEAMIQHIAHVRGDILAVENEPRQWYVLYQRVSGADWQHFSRLLLGLLEMTHVALDLEAIRSIQELSHQVAQHHEVVQRAIGELLPWIPLFERVPEVLLQARFSPMLDALRACLRFNPPLEQIPAITETALEKTARLRGLLDQARPGDAAAFPDHEGHQAGLVWLEALEQTLLRARENARQLVGRFEHVARRIEQTFQETDFTFLYHPRRRVFHLGFNLDTGQPDHNFYDLLASEARIASIVAIAKGDAPLAHWLQLGRPLSEVGAAHVLLSWSATMFEYLMPPLFLGSSPGTLLAESAQGAVLRQMAYGKEKGVPWGISESGFYQFDNNQNYQYRAFGVPGLGFKRGLADDLVIAPYASLMAIAYDPRAVMQNLQDLIARGLLGRYGFYEAIDFTAERMPLGETSATIREYMAHHQGMSLMAIDNFLHADIMARRMHGDVRIQSVDLLLQEQVPYAVPLQNPSDRDIHEIAKLLPSAEKIEPWRVPVQTPIPMLHLLSNGSYSLLISNMGGGYSRWRDTDLTRWQPDAVLDSWGAWIYIQDMEGNAPGAGDLLWSAAHQPRPGAPEEVQVTYMAHMAVFRRRKNNITSTLEITVTPEDPVEIRRLHLYNTGDSPRRLRLTSYGEVILTGQANDARHPAFNRLFIESETVPELNLQIFKRRPRSNQEKPVFMAHMLVTEAGPAGKAAQSVRHEADRYRFTGRRRSAGDPAALQSAAYLSGASGATLDPIFALGWQVEIQPHQGCELAFLTFAGESREAMVELAGRYQRWDLLERSFRQSEISAEGWLRQKNIDAQALQGILQVLSTLIYPFKAVRAPAEILSANRLSQAGLWRFGISGDFPILCVELADPGQIELAAEVLQAHRFLRARGFWADVVFLNRQQSDYGAELRDRLFRLTRQAGSDQWLNQRGGIFILHADQISGEEAVLLLSAARLALSGDKGGLGSQLPGYSLPVHHLPEFAPSRLPEKANPPAAERPLPGAETLQFYNGFGGFSPDGREYWMPLPAGKSTPAPWVNVIGYPHFGFLVSESGSQTTWALNSGENRLTPWPNDPVSDAGGEALYLRDEETGEVWSPSPFPAGDGQAYLAIHGMGYSRFEHDSHGLSQSLTLFASPEDPVKIFHLKVKNSLERARRITATLYVEWVLGTTRAVSSSYLQPEYDPDHECMLATNPYSQEFGERTAFLIANKQIHGLTADRTEFLGRAGTMAYPAALRRLGLETRISPGDEVCAALQVHLDLPPGAAEEIYFVLGQGSTRAQAILLADKYHNPVYVGAARERTRVFWDNLLEKIQVHTPNPALDLLLNRWLLYQALSCRVWGRTGLYQSSGAFGFRDQLQDVLALLAIDPNIARGQILNTAQRQFEAGDVLHWWHPPSGRGVRTRFSDDLLWLPYVTAQYIEASGDASILAQEIPFLQAPPLKPGEAERYGEFPPTARGYSLLEHCLRAIEAGATHGPHGLPLIGAGDWNDGMNRVGEEGKGESVWLAWFLCDVLNRFSTLCEREKEGAAAARCRALAQEYAAAVEKSAWDGAWYRRAYFDNGAPLGSAQSSECKIDAIAQSWAVISAAGDPQRGATAMQSVWEQLVRPQDRLVLLFTPPFDQTEEDPGYIKGYAPGIRENGGQYTHAAVWTGWAFARLGDGERAGQIFDLLNPIWQSDTQAKAADYRNEPYVICADIYSVPPWIRRGGWTWYTGSAAWMYRFGLEALLGWRKQGDLLQFEPVIPAGWDGFEVSYRFGGTVYHIQVSNPVHAAPRRGATVLLDGTPIDGPGIQLVDDGGSHQVVLRYTP